MSKEGLPEQVIPQVCEELNAGIVVLGILGELDFLPLS